MISGVRPLLHAIGIVPFVAEVIDAAVECPRPDFFSFIRIASLSVCLDAAKAVFVDGIDERCIAVFHDDALLHDVRGVHRQCPSRMRVLCVMISSEPCTRSR